MNDFCLMKQKRRQYYYKKTIPLLMVIISGCSDNENITYVKQHVFNYIDNAISVGNALDSRKMCSSTKWIQITDKRNRNVIEYTCELSGFYPLFERLIRDDFVRKENDELSLIKIRENNLASAKNMILQLNNLKSALSELKEKKLLSEYVRLATLPHLVHSSGLYAVDGLYDARFIFEEQNGHRIRDNHQEDDKKIILIENKIRDIIKNHGVKSEYFYALPLSTNNFLAITDKERESKVEEYLKEYRDIVIKNNSSINILKAKISKYKIIQSDLEKKAREVKGTQHVVFSIDNKEPIPVECFFLFEVGDTNTFKVNLENCFSMAYESNYNKRYESLFKYVIDKKLSE